MALPDSYRPKSPAARTSGISSASIQTTANYLGAEVDNATNKDAYAHAEVVFSFPSAPTAGRPLKLYLLYSLDGCTTWRLVTLPFGGKRVYVAGDTENVPEMMKLKNIDIAFLPMNVPYTMSPEMVASAARAIRPAVIYPYHYGDTDTRKLTALLKNEKGIEVRIRKLS